MSLSLALKLAGGVLMVALALVALVALVVDRNRLADLNDRRLACTAAVAGKPGAKPPQSVCDPPVVLAASTAAQADACDAALQAATAKGTPAVCSASGAGRRRSPRRLRRRGGRP